MINSQNYTWQTAYNSTILETDPTKMHGRIHDALKLIDARLSNPGQIDETERKAIEHARTGLTT
jgi:hypothetical protein